VGAGEVGGGRGGVGEGWTSSAVPRRARIYGAWTFVSLNSRLESKKKKRKTSSAEPHPEPPCNSAAFYIPLLRKSTEVPQRNRYPAAN